MKCPKCNHLFHTPTLEEFEYRDFLYVAYRCPKPECQTVISIECDKGQMEDRIVARIRELLGK